jgi:hypothetical protein
VGGPGGLPADDRRGLAGIPTVLFAFIAGGLTAGIVTAWNAARPKTPAALAAATGPP